MPKVPQYSQMVQPRALQTGSASGVSPGAFGNAARQLQQGGQAIQRQGGFMAEVAIKQQEEKNLERVLAAKTAFEAEAAEVIARARNLQGANAYGVTDQTSEWWRNTVSKHVGAMENPEQRRALQKMLDEKWPAVKSNVYGHEIGQTHAAANASMKASIQSATDLALANHNDDTIRQQAITDISRTVGAQQAVNGWTSDVAAEAKAAHLTALHKGVIDAKLDEDPRAAEAYFEANKEQIRGVEHDGIREALTTGKRLREAQSFADQMDAAGVPEEDALRLAREKYEGEEEAEAIAEITRRHSQKAAARARAANEAYNEAAVAMVDEGVQYHQLPPSLTARMSPEQREKLRKVGFGTETNWSTYYGLKQLAAVQPGVFATMNVQDYFGDLAPTERKEIIGLHTAAKKNPKDPKLGRSQWETMQQYASAAGLDVKEAKEDGDKGERVRGFYSRFDAEVEAHRAATGREPSSADLNEIGQRLAIEVTRVVNWGFDLERPAAEAEVVDARGRPIPLDQVDELAAALKAAGDPVTDANIRALYEYLKQRQ